jgi:hypothetical protein
MSEAKKKTAEQYRTRQTEVHQEQQREQGMQRGVRVDPKRVCCSLLAKRFQRSRQQAATAMASVRGLIFLSCYALSSVHIFLEKTTLL